MATPTEQELWDNYLDWYVHQYSGLSNEAATAYGDNVITQAISLFERNLTRETQSILNTFGIVGQFVFDSDMTWAEHEALQAALLKHLTDTVFKWFGDNYPDASKAVLLGLIEWAPNFVMDKLSVPETWKTPINKILTTYFGSKVDGLLGIDPTKPPPAILDQLYADLTALKTSADKYMPLIANLVFGINRTLENNQSQITNLQTQIMWAVSSVADVLA
jgi:hypothetical protein